MAMCVDGAERDHDGYGLVYRELDIEGGAGIINCNILFFILWPINEMYVQSV